ncbi:hypothetical protein DEJ00_11295 [Curtobacterium sp. MCLR17_039]|nr:hypothetical protein DEJ00_11295 [Curtobacterium sp. MCLR17_039]
MRPCAAATAGRARRITRPRRTRKPEPTRTKKPARASPVRRIGPTTDQPIETPPSAHSTHPQNNSRLAVCRKVRMSRSSCSIVGVLPGSDSANPTRSRITSPR